MAKKQTDTPEEIKRPSLRSLFDKILSTLETEIDRLPETLEGVPRRGDWISYPKTSLSSSNTGSPDKETPGLVTGEIDREIGILTKD